MNDLVKLGIKKYEENALQEALEILMPLGSADSPQAQYYLGLIYCDSDFDQDYEVAADWFRKARANNYFESSYSLGCLNLQNLIKQASLETAIELFEEAFESGINEGYFELGKYYISKEDPSKALYFFNASAERNHPPSINAIGVCYSQGNGVDKNFDLAKNMFMKSSHMGYGNASINLAKLLNETDATTDSVIAAVLPAITFCPELLPFELLRFQFYEPSYYSAFNDFIEPLARNGNALALNYLGEREIYSGLYKLRAHFPRLDKKILKRPINFDIRIHYCRDLRYVYEELGYFIDQYGPLEGFNLAQFSEMKELQLNDFFPDFPNALNKAVEFFELSAGNDCEYANFNLGMINLFGLAGEVNEAKAIIYFDRAAQKGHIGALAELAFLNRSVSEDDGFQAIVNAANYEHPKACHELGSFYLQQSSILTEAHKGFEYFKTLVDHNRPDAMYIVAQLYIEGIGTEKDLEAARFLLTQSAQLGWKKSEDLLQSV